MNTCLITASYLDGVDGLGNDRMERNKFYLKYYAGIQQELGFQTVYFLDNGSSEKSRLEIANYALSLGLRFELMPYQSLARDGNGQPHDYPYLWRSLWMLKIFMTFYDKLLVIDSDAFILSQRLADWIKNRDTGWNALWCPKYAFPEAAIQILCKDTFGIYDAYTTPPWRSKLGLMMEHDIPFTHTFKDFIGDRFGEISRPQEPCFDFYCQSRLSVPLHFIS